MFDLLLQLIVFIYLLLICISIADTQNNTTPTYNTIILPFVVISSDILNISANNITTTLDNNVIKETISLFVILDDFMVFIFRINLF